MPSHLVGKLHNYINHLHILLGEVTTLWNVLAMLCYAFEQNVKMLECMDGVEWVIPLRLL